MLFKAARQIEAGVCRSRIVRTLPAVVLWVVALSLGVHPACAAPSYVRAESWKDTVVAIRRSLSSGRLKRDNAAKMWIELERDFPIRSDWVLQDFGDNSHLLLSGRLETGDLAKVLGRILEEIGPAAGKLSADLSRLKKNKVAGISTWADRTMPIPRPSLMLSMSATLCPARPCAFWRWTVSTAPCVF